MTDKNNQQVEEEYIQYGDDPKIFISDMPIEAQELWEERKMFIRERDAATRRYNISIVGCEVLIKQILDQQKEAEVVEVEDESS
jgi:hypothetical protein